MCDQHNNYYARHHCRRQCLMKQSEAEDKRVRGDECDTCTKQYPGAGKHSTVFFHDLHPWPRWPILLATRSHPEDKLQVADSHRSALLNLQARFIEDIDHFGKADMTMPVKMRNDASFSG